MPSSNKKNTANANLFTTHRACPLCGADDATPVYSWHSFQFFSDSKTNNNQINLHTVQCRNCLCVYMNPCYTKLGFEILFKKANGSYGSALEVDDDIPNLLAREGIIRPGSYVLDAGCYNGRHLAKFPTYVHCIGVDIDAPAIALGKERYPEFEFICSPLESFTTSHPVDVILMHHVLEHLVDPSSVLKNLYATSSHDATLVIESPILENVINQCAVGFFTPHHLTHFSKTTLKNILCSTGWIPRDGGFSMEDYNGFRIIASKGQASKDYTINFMDKQVVLDMANSVNTKAKDIEIRINDLLTDCDHVSIWGAGMHLEALYQKTTLFHRSRKLKYTIVDASKTLQGSTWRGHPIYSPSVLRDKDWAREVLIVSSYASTPSIVKDSRSIGIPANKVVTLYDEFAS